jgi:hypothetical protein
MRQAILLLLLVLEGCVPDQAKNMDVCRTEAEHFYHLYNAIDPKDPSSQFIIACMAAKGYEFAITPEDCNSRYPLPTQAACYVPNDWVGWTIDRVRRAFKSKEGQP